MSSKTRDSALGARRSALGARYSALGARRSALGGRCTALGARRAAWLLALLLAACGAPSGSAPTTPGDDAHRRLPTGRRLDPAGTLVDAGNLPLGLALSPDGNSAVLLLSGFREQGVQVIDRQRGKVAVTFPIAGAFLGVAFSPDGKTVAASGGNSDAIYLFSWHDGRVWLTDSILLAKKAPRTDGTRYPAGLAWSRDGALLYVAENLADSLAVVNVANKRVVQRFPTERYPYGVVVAADGNVYVSAWGGSTVSTFIDGGGGALTPTGLIIVGRHPSAMTLNADGTRLFVASASTDRVAVVDTRRRAVITQLLDPPPAGPGEGSTPDALALSASGTRLFVAEADNNAVAVFDLSAATSAVKSAAGRDALVGRIPVGWYPSALAVHGDSLIVVNAKGRGTHPNVGGPYPGLPSAKVPASYTLGMLNGTVTTIPVEMGDSLALAGTSARVAKANGWDAPRTAAKYPPFEHVIYVIKENRTFDQILSDIPNADGDTSLRFFPRSVSPNHHALAQRFGAYDRFFVNAEVSADGHNWSDAAYAADYVEKTVGLTYGDQGRSYDYEGYNRDGDDIAEDDVNEPASGYLWDAAARAGVTYRDYGEFTAADSTRRGTPQAPFYYGNKRVLAGHVDSLYPNFNTAIKDQYRIDRWLEEFREFERTGVMPALMTMWLPDDHTSGLRAGLPSPRAAFADNDLALGRLIDALSHSKFWKNTVVFVVEDDAQNGPDHVDSHRSVMFAISAYSRGGVQHRFTNTTDVIATIIEVLHLGSLSQFDFYGRPLRDVFNDSADLTPYAALVPEQSLDEMNPPAKISSRSGRPLDLSAVDRADEDDFNRELWLALKGPGVPYPGIRRMSALEAARAR